MLLQRRLGKFTSPTWSPDGRSLAWEDSQGIWVGTLGAIGGKSCQISINCNRNTPAQWKTFGVNTWTY